MFHLLNSFSLTEFSICYLLVTFCFRRSVKLNNVDGNLMRAFKTSLEVVTGDRVPVILVVMAESRKRGHDDVTCTGGKWCDSRDQTFLRDQRSSAMRTSDMTVKEQLLKFKGKNHSPYSVRSQTKPCKGASPSSQTGSKNRRLI